MLFSYGLWKPASFFGAEAERFFLLWRPGAFVFAAEAGRAYFFLRRPGAVFAVPGALRGRSTRDAILRENAWTDAPR